MSGPQALFYALEEVPTRVEVAVRPGLVPVDVVEFPAEEGGEVRRELALPWLPGMEEVEVEEASLAFAAAAREIESSRHTLKPVASGPDAGVVVALPEPGRLRKVEIQVVLPPESPAGPKPRWVVRPAEPQGSGFRFGPPLYAAPDFAPPGPMFPRVLTGLAAWALPGDRHLLELPSPLGSAWLIQYAAGDEPTKLAAIPLDLRVTKVVVEGLPRDLSIVLAQADGTEAPLWSHPDLLLPESGRQEASFTPLAQKELAAALAARRGASDSTSATLPVQLTLRSKSGATLNVASRVLAARYRVHPGGQAPITLRLEGDRAPLALTAPAGPRPERSTVRLTARLAGRELNPGSPEPPAAPPAAGLQVAGESWAALGQAFLPPAGAVENRPLAGVRLLLAATEDSEGVLELRSDAAGAPGPPLTPPMVRQIAAGFSGWQGFDPAAPFPVGPGEAPLWLVLRVTRGRLFWFAQPPSGSGARLAVSHDRGRTWGAPEPSLAGAGAPLAQLFHLSPEPLARPVIRLEQAGRVLLADWPGPAWTGADGKELAAGAIALPAALIAALSAPGQAGIAQRFDLFSTSVLELTLSELALVYDPWAGGA